MDINRLCPKCMKEVAGEKRGSFCTNCGYDLREIQNDIHQLQPFTILNDKYIVGKAIGEGGLGITYLGLDQTLESRVAIKEFYPNGFVTRESNVTSSVTIYAGKRQSDFEKWRENYLREARSLAQFSGLSGIVEVKEFFSQNNTVYIVIEFVDGISLKEYLKQAGGKLALDKTLQMMEPIIRSLAKVHECGLIHRGISPDNIMIDQSGEMKLLDFGVAQDISEDGEKGLSILLKPGYAAEEQYRTRGNQGPWSDVYAICATIYKCITGNTPIESMKRLQNDELVMPRALGIPISDNIEAILKMGLAVYADKRFQNMGALYVALYGEVRTAGAGSVSISNSRPIVEERKTSTFPILQKKSVRQQPLVQDIQPTGVVLPTKKKSGALIYIFIVIGLAVCILGGINIYKIVGDKPVNMAVENDEQSEDKTETLEMQASAEEVNEDIQQLLTQAEETVQDASRKVADASTRGEAFEKLQEAISLYQQAGEEENAFVFAEAGINAAMSEYMRGVCQQVDMLLEQGTHIDIYNQISMDLNATLDYGQKIAAAGYSLDMRTVQEKKDAFEVEYRERFIWEFNEFSNEEQWNVRYNEEFMRGAYEHFTSEERDDAIRLRYSYAYAWLVHQEVFEKMTSGEMDAEGAVNYITEALEKADYNEFLIEDAEMYARQAGGSWVNKDYFKEVNKDEIISDSNTKEYSIEEIKSLGLNAAELRYARYEIYARHGMKTWDETANQKLSRVNTNGTAIARERFMSYNDFGPYSADDNNGLTEIERHNVRSIMQASFESGTYLK